MVRSLAFLKAFYKGRGLTCLKVFKPAMANFMHKRRLTIWSTLEIRYLLAEF